MSKITVRQCTAIRIGLDLLDGHTTVLAALTANPNLAADILLAHQYRNGDQAQALQLARVYDQAMLPKSNLKGASR